MTGNTSTGRRLSALFLAMVVIGSVLAAFVGPAAAAAGNVTIANGPFTVDESGDSVTVSADVTADSSGISNGTVTFDVVNSSGTSVYQASTTIDVAANNTQSVSFAFDPETAGVQPGDYTVEVTADTVTSTANLSVNDVAIEIPQLGDANHEIGTSSEINVDVTNNGTTNRTNVTLVSTVLDANNNVVTTIETTKNIDAGTTATYGVDLPGDAINESGEYRIEHNAYVETGDNPVAAQTQVLNVAEAGGGGAVLPSNGFSGDSLLIGAGILVIIGLVALAARAD